MKTRLTNPSLKTEFHCGGKVFIVGEYACLERLPALVWSVPPEFKLTIKNSAGKSPFAAASPAGIFLNHNAPLLAECSLEWSDPYTTPIGVGSSSAQFLLSVAAIQSIKNEPMLSAEQALRLYWECVGTTQGLRPSGLDIVAQSLGGVHLIANEPFSASALADWNATDAAFLLVFTGSKAKTHEHLLALQANGFPGLFKETLRVLNEITFETVEAWKGGKTQSLAASLDEYQLLLEQDGFSNTGFAELVASVRKIPGVLAAKGCGAQGGDSLLLFVEREKLSSVEEMLVTMKLEPFRLEKSARALQG